MNTSTRRKGLLQRHPNKTKLWRVPFLACFLSLPPMNGSAKSNGHGHTDAGIKRRRPVTAAGSRSLSDKAKTLSKPRDFCTRWEVPRKVLHGSIGVYISGPPQSSLWPHRLTFNAIRQVLSHSVYICSGLHVSMSLYFLYAGPSLLLRPQTLSGLRTLHLRGYTSAYWDL